MTRPYNCVNSRQRVSHQVNFLDMEWAKPPSPWCRPIYAWLFIRQPCKRVPTPRFQPLPSHTTWGGEHLRESCKAISINARSCRLQMDPAKCLFLRANHGHFCSWRLWTQGIISISTPSPGLSRGPHPLPDPLCPGFPPSLDSQSLPTSWLICAGKWMVVDGGRQV